MIRKDGWINIEQLRKEIVFEVMRDLKSKEIFVSPELRVIRQSLNSNITKVLSRIE